MAKKHLPIHYKIEQIMELVQALENAFGTMSSVQLAKLDVKQVEAIYQRLNEMEKDINIAITRWEIKKIIAETEDLAFMARRKARQRLELLKGYREDVKVLKTRTQRLIDGKPADKNSPLIMIGGDETYEARCIKCYELPDALHDKQKIRLKLLQFHH